MNADAYVQHKLRAHPLLLFQTLISDEYQKLVELIIRDESRYKHKAISLGMKMKVSTENV